VVASVIGKKIKGGTYYYLAESARVDGKPRIISQRYLGSAAEIAAAMDGAAVMPDRTRHLAFGAVAAGWGVLTRLGVVELLDEVVGARRADAGASVGTYLALAVLNRLTEPCSKRAMADWWAGTAGDRFTRIGASVLEHRRFWDATHRITAAQLAEAERAITAAMIGQFALDCSAVALDMTNFATFIDSGNDKAELAQRGKAKQKRADLRLVGLGLVVTRDGGIPLVSHTYPGNRPDVTQFTAVLDELCARYRAVFRPVRPGDPAETAGETAGEVTVVFDAGQNSAANFAHLRGTGIGYVTSLPPSDHLDLLAVPSGDFQIVDLDRFARLTAFETTKPIAGRPTRLICTHSPTLHAAQARGFDQTLTKVQARLAELAARLERGKTRRARAAVEADIAKICKDTWTRRVIKPELTGDQPADLRLSWGIDTTAQHDLEEQIFGKRVLATNRDSWPIGDVVAAYRSQSDAEFGFRQLKDPHMVSFSPMYHWTDQAIRVHMFTCVLALQLAHLMRRQAAHAGLDLSVRALIDTLAGVEETVLIYPSTGGRPKARRMLTDTTTDQDKLIKIFNLDQWAPVR
jgi:transposase